jgi:hypothetical protein
MQYNRPDGCWRDSCQSHPFLDLGWSPPESTRTMNLPSTEAWYSPYTPRRRWPHSGTLTICPGTRSRACTLEGEEVETEGSARVPRSWYSVFQSLWWRCDKGEKWEEMHFSSFIFSSLNSHACAPTSAIGTAVVVPTPTWHCTVHRAIPNAILIWSLP